MGAKPDGAGRLILWLALCLALLALALWRWPAPGWLATDFKSLLPGGQTNPWYERAANAASANFDQQLVLLVQGGAPGQAASFVAAARSRLSDAGYIDVDFEQEQAQRWSTLADTLYPFRWGLLSAQDRERLQDNPQGYFQEFRRLLYSPLGIQQLQTLETDPLGQFTQFMRSLAPGSQPAHGDGGQSELVALALQPGMLGFSTLPGLQAIHEELLREAQQQGLQLSMSGVPLYSASGVVSAQAEMSTIGVASLLALVLLLAWSLRSLLAMALTLVCVGAGLAGGFVITVALLGELHILTLVFGATLIGISADYALHYLAHSRQPGWTPATGLAKVFRAGLLGMLSSVLAFSALVLLPFPGIRQIGVFMASGLVCSFLTMCLLFPALFRRSGAVQPPAGLFQRRPAVVHWSPWFVVPVLLLSIAALGLMTGRDDVRTFYASPIHLDQAQERIAQFTGHRADSRYLLVQAVDGPTLLEQDAAAALRLQGLVDEHALAGYSAISELLPPAQQQLAAVSLWQQVAGQGIVDRYLEGMGFPAEFIQATASALQQAPAPASLDILQGLDLPLGVGGFLGCDTNGCASWIRLWGVNDDARLQQLAAGLPALTLVDPIGIINGDIARYRQSVALMLLLAAALATLLLALAAGPRAALRIILVPVLASVMTLALLGVFREGYSLVNLMGILLVFGVGLDYGVFRTFTPAGDQPATSLAIALSAVTSILAFGMLAFSVTPVIASFGETIALGLLFAYGLSWLRWQPGDWK